MTKYDYDLNIFMKEEQGPDGTYDHVEPWYLHIYEAEPGMHYEHGEPIQLTETEANSLIKTDPYFDGQVDAWYGLEGFIRDKAHLLSDRLKELFYRLPVYKEEVLF